MGFQPTATYVNCINCTKLHNSLGSHVCHFYIFHVQSADQSTLMCVALCHRKVERPRSKLMYTTPLHEQHTKRNAPVFCSSRCLLHCVKWAYHMYRNHTDFFFQPERLWAIKNQQIGINQWTNYRISWPLRRTFSPEMWPKFDLRLVRRLYPNL